MSKAEILEYFNDINVAYNNCGMHDSLSNMLAEFEQEIRAKAIDEFAERLKPIIDEKIKGWTNSDDLRRWCERSIDEIAEEMRGAE